MRLDNYSSTDLGASALISPVNQNYNYVIINKFGRIEEIT
jgi:hypothetical protein